MYMVKRLMFWIVGLGLPLLIAAGVFFSFYEYTSVLKMRSGGTDIQLQYTTLIAYRDTVNWEDIIAVTLAA
jgi:hypothetical protein